MLLDDPFPSIVVSFKADESVVGEESEGSLSSSNKVNWIREEDSGKPALGGDGFGGADMVFLRWIVVVVVIGEVCFVV